MNARNHRGAPERGEARVYYASAHVAARRPWLGRHAFVRWLLVVAVCGLALLLAYVWPERPFWPAIVAALALYAPGTVGCSWRTFGQACLLAALTAGCQCYVVWPLVSGFGLGAGCAALLPLWALWAHEWLIRGNMSRRAFLMGWVVFVGVVAGIEPLAVYERARAWHTPWESVARIGGPACYAVLAWSMAEALAAARWKSIWRVGVAVVLAIGCLAWYGVALTSVRRAFLVHYLFTNYPVSTFLAADLLAADPSDTATAAFWASLDELDIAPARWSRPMIVRSLLRRDPVEASARLAAWLKCNPSGEVAELTARDLLAQGRLGAVPVILRYSLLGHDGCTDALLEIGEPRGALGLAMRAVKRQAWQPGEQERSRQLLDVDMGDDPGQWLMYMLDKRPYAKSKLSSETAAAADRVIQAVFDYLIARDKELEFIRRTGKRLGVAEPNLNAGGVEPFEEGVRRYAEAVDRALAGKAGTP